MNSTYLPFPAPRALRLAALAVTLVSAIGGASASQIAGNTIGSVVVTKPVSASTKTTTSSTVSTKKSTTTAAPAASKAKH